MLSRDVIVAGASSLDVHLRSSARDTDLQVTLSEVRPDGRETYVQNGWLRASHRKLDRRASTALDPLPTHLRQDAAPLPRGAYALVRVPIFPVGARLPGGLEDPGDGPGGRRRPTALGLRARSTAGAHATRSRSAGRAPRSWCCPSSRARRRRARRSRRRQRCAGSPAGRTSPRRTAADQRLPSPWGGPRPGWRDHPKEVWPARPARRMVGVMKTPRVIPVPRVGPSPHAPRQ